MNDSFNKPREPQLDENDPVWRLLAESPRPEPDAWFAARAVARCRSEKSVREFSFRSAWRWMLGCGLGFSLAMLLTASPRHVVPATPDKQKNVQEAFEIMASMDSSDSSSSSGSSWQDSSL